MMAALNAQSLALFSSERLLNCMVEGSGIALLGWILLRVLGRRNSGTRFAVWFSALLLIAAFPVFDSLGAGGAGLSSGYLFSQSLTSLSLSSGSFSSESAIMVPASWALYMFAAWAVIAFAGLVRVGISLWHLRRVRRSCVPIDLATLDPALRQTLEKFSSSRTVTICASDGVRVPTAIGFARPLVVIPAWALRELSPAELNAIVLHELAHLGRWDDWTNLVQRILGALLFFHPAVWWIESKLCLEREMACDDLVLARTTNPLAYAECLVSLAEKSYLRRGLAMAQAAVTRMRQTSSRVLQILDGSRPTGTAVWKPAPLLFTAFSIVCLFAASYTPSLVGFERSDSSLTAQTSGAQTSGMDANEMRNASSQVVTAKLHLNSSSGKNPVTRGFAAKPMALAAKLPAAKLPAVRRDPAVIAAKAEHRRAHFPPMVRAGVEENSLVPQTLFVVMQTQEYDGYGSAVWSVRVWQVTLVRPVPDRVFVKATQMRTNQVKKT